MSERKRPQPETIWVESGFGYHGREPFVSLKLRDVAVMVSPAEARDLAANLLQCAESAESDGFLMTWAAARLDADERVAVALLREFRAYREERRASDHD